jgi:hypothetical protein
LHSEIGCLALSDAAQKTSFLQSTLNRVVNHVMRDDSLFWALDAFKRMARANNIHPVVLATTFGADQLH